MLSAPSRSPRCGARAWPGAAFGWAPCDEAASTGVDEVEEAAEQEEEQEEEEVGEGGLAGCHLVFAFFKMEEVVGEGVPKNTRVLRGANPSSPNLTRGEPLTPLNEVPTGESRVPKDVPLDNA